MQNCNFNQLFLANSGSFYIAKIVYIEVLANSNTTSSSIEVLT